MHHPERRIVAISVVGFKKKKKKGHRCINLTPKIVNPRDIAGDAEEEEKEGEGEEEEGKEEEEGGEEEEEDYILRQKSTTSEAKR